MAAITRNDIIEKALELGYSDAGVTGVDPFISQQERLAERGERYAWAPKMGLDLIKGTTPLAVYPEARSIIVLIEPYFRTAFPPALEAHFGRWYLEDDRVTKDGRYLRLQAFRAFLKKAGVESRVPFNLPHRLTSTRAGLGTLGKNNFFYANRGARGGSWTMPYTIMVDREFPCDEPTMEYTCPAWCRNACIAACPTRAIEAPGKLDPRRCIAYLSYYGEGPTPLELREPMRLRLYGCDRCQDVCPRNEAWLALSLPFNEKLAARENDFTLSRLLSMDDRFYRERVWPRMFYMSQDDLWRWKMNAARAMGNSRDRDYVPDLVEALRNEDDPRVRGMVAWALGQLGGAMARQILESRRSDDSDLVRGEVEGALETARGS
ncbi:MAG: HEAT repeat domain-containing protein [Syntrophales bacterium]|nr:HEAT repeat domain-containing protein [Syntrophales bacterium]MCK9528005.1 HEAT repeat domain-containing protein [Syntrophales bacterium]MDX9921418.1 HEAT repeat domain-containing protein [Syntrophales bacterium]